MVKVISLSNEAYEKLKMRKNGMSFSELVIGLVEKKPKRNIMDFFGIWAGRKDEWAKIGKEIYKDRKKFKFREVKF